MGEADFDAAWDEGAALSLFGQWRIETGGTALAQVRTR
jgi:hypothetical protein